MTCWHPSTRLARLGQISLFIITIKRTLVTLSTSLIYPTCPRYSTIDIRMYASQTSLTYHLHQLLKDTKSPPSHIFSACGTPPQSFISDSTDSPVCLSTDQPFLTIHREYDAPYGVDRWIYPFIENNVGLAEALSRWTASEGH